MTYNMNPKKCAMPMQDAKERAKNFSEVALGYDIETAKEEAMRCLNCKNPVCVKGCPVNIDIPGFISKVKEQYPEIDLTKYLFLRDISLHININNGEVNYTVSIILWLEDEQGEEFFTEFFDLPNINSSPL